jgi:NADPH:quinone reductase-like Zn-dependent oxidoreductase
LPGRVVAAGRSARRLERLRALGADATVSLAEVDNVTAEIREAAGGAVDVIIDLLWGDSAVAALGAAAPMARHVQLGHIAGATITLPAPTVRSAPVAIMGYANFHVPIDERRRAYLRITDLAARGDLMIDLERFALEDVETAWERQRRGSGTKLVVVL